MSQQNIQSKPINLTKLKQLLHDGLQNLKEDPNATQAVIVIGDTGVGKSTMLTFLTGAQMVVRMDGLKPVLQALDPSSVNIKIGHQKYSETSIPNKIMIEELAFYDCPGFKDNKGEEYQISNSFFVQRLLDIYKNVKIVLLIDDSHISQTRADKLPKLTKNLLRSFKNFQEIREGVIMIINKTDRDVEPQKYYSEIKKMCDLKNQAGLLFSLQEQNFLRYLCDNEKIGFFHSPKRDQKDQIYKPTPGEAGILDKIRTSNFVRSKHINNILSESAKLAIRDFVDEITASSNLKIQSICEQILEIYMGKMNRSGRNVNALINLKQTIVNLAEDIKAAEGQKIVQLLQRQVGDQKVEDFSQNFNSIMFFKGVYDKTSTYFSNLVNKIYTELSHLLVKMDQKITKVQKQEQQNMQRQKLQQKRKEMQMQREREKLQIKQKMDKMIKLKNQVFQMSGTSQTMMSSLGQTINVLNNLTDQFNVMRKEAQGIQTQNQEMHHNLNRIQATYIRKVVN